MSAMSGWGYQEPVDDAARPPEDHRVEPVGYDLGGAPVFEQPPTQLSQYAVTPSFASRGQAITGFVLSVVGLPAAALLSVFGLPLVFAGLLLSAWTLGQCRRGQAAGRGFALAGTIIGILGFVAALVSLVVLFAPFQ
jgi:hypothetical protein